MHVVVTGGAGFIGSHVVDRLVGTGAEVTVVDDLSTGQRLRLDGAAPSGALTFVEADCTDVACADLLAQARPDVVCHLAAQIDVRASVADPVYDVERNVLATLRVLESCRAAGVGRFVFASSGGAMYGDAEGRPTDETAPLRPSSPYGAAKAAVEMYLSAYRASYGLESVSLALGNVYGERQDATGEAGVVAVFGSALLAGRQATIFGDGTATRDFVHVADVAAAFVGACRRGAGRYNIGTGVETSVRKLHRRLAGLVGVDDDPAYASARPGELAASALDAARAARDLDWRPQVPLDAGLARTLDWLRHSAAHSSGQPAA